MLANHNSVEEEEEEAGDILYSVLANIILVIH